MQNMSRSYPPWHEQNAPRIEPSTLRTTKPSYKSFPSPVFDLSVGCTVNFTSTYELIWNFMDFQVHNMPIYKQPTPSEALELLEILC